MDEIQTERLAPGTRLFHGTRAQFHGAPRLPAMFELDAEAVEFYTRESWRGGESPRVIEVEVTAQAKAFVVARRWSEVANALGSR